MDKRTCRNIAKDIGLTVQERAEIQRILQEDDYTAAFPLTAPVTYAKVFLLIDILQDHGQSLDKTVPIAVSLIDQVATVSYGNLKRSCLRYLHSGKDLHDKIDFLYAPADDSLGPFCSKIGISKKWLIDAHQETLQSGITICNGVILELYQHFRKCRFSWETARKWMALLYPDCTALPPTQTLSTDWKRLQEKKSRKGSKSLKEELLNAEYKLPMVQPTKESVPSNDDPCSATSSNEDQDMYHAQYDSPVKKLLVKHIQEQDDTITELLEAQEKHQGKLIDLKSDYDSLLQNKKDILKDKNLFQHEITLLQKREEELQNTLQDLHKEFSPPKVKKQLKYREKRIAQLEGYADEYKHELEVERDRIEKLKQNVTIEKHAKRKSQKRVYYYKCRAKPLESLQDAQIRELLKGNSELQYENENLQSQLNECMEDKFVKTFEGGRFVDGVRLVCYDFLSRNVGTEHVAPLIRSVLEKMTNMGVGRLPKPTLVKLMALEADILSKKHAARELLNSKNVTLHTDATSKKDRHYYSYQMTTETGSYSLDLQETVGGDTETQIQTTKTLLKELADLVAPEEVNKADRPTEYKLLFNIRNTMTDRGPTSKGWVEGLQVWRESVLRDNVMPHLTDFSKESIRKLSTINDFYCGKHFLLGLADRAKVGLNLWEEEIIDFSGPIGREELPEFKSWGCQKPTGYRLVRTACELFGPGAKPPHGMPTLFNDLLNGDKNYIPQFEHNRFNIVFVASSAIYHHLNLIQHILTSKGSDNKLHKSVLADLNSDIPVAEVRAMGLVEKHITTPLATITSRKEHILNMKQYYKRLKEFLTEMIACAGPIMNGSAVLFEDCPPIKDPVWASLYRSASPEQDALTEQIVGILCASFAVVLERQLFDFLGGKWSGDTGNLREETQNVPRNNDISERDFSGLDRLLRVKSSARLDFIRGLILYTHNKTALALKQMSEDELNNELSSAVKLARASLDKYKKRREELKRQRLAALEEKKKKKEELEKNRIKLTQKAIDNVGIDGQQKDATGVQRMLAKYATDKDKKLALKRQLDYYKTLKIKSIPHQKFNMSSDKKFHSVEKLTENLLFIIEMWTNTINASTSGQTAIPTNKQKIEMSAIANHKIRITNLKRKLVSEAEAERCKKAKNSAELISEYPGDDLIGTTINHKYEVKSKTGKTTQKWFKGLVLRKASDVEKLDASEDDLQASEETGCSIFMVHYEKHTCPEAIALQLDWENGDVHILEN